MTRRRSCGAVTVVLLGVLPPFAGCISPEAALKWFYSQTREKIVDAQSVDGDLETSDLKIVGNPRGEGLFLYPQNRPPSTGPLIAWACVRGTPYAVNEATQQLTPGLALLEDAPVDALKDSALRRGRFEEQVRARLTSPDARPR